MNEHEENRPPRPALCLRIGITGMRRLRTIELKRIREQTSEMLAFAQQEMKRLARDARVSPFYAHADDGYPAPILRMISPIARGADRVAAQAALDLQYELCVPMPFGQKEYEKDFIGREDGHDDEPTLTAKEDLQQFHDLLSHHSAVIQLDGARKLYPTDDDRSLEGFSYEYVGHFVVRHCDVLIAIWDGKVSRGRGGTADIVRYASSVGVPVWWINSTQSVDPVWLADRHDCHDFNPAARAAKPDSPPIAAAKDKLHKHLERLIPMPALAARISDTGSNHRKARKKSHPPDPSLAPAEIYFNERPRPANGIWKTYSWMMSLFRESQPEESASSKTSSPPALAPVPQYWHERYKPADDRAGEYAARYRSSYVLIILCATLALGLGSLALGFIVGHKTHPESIAKWIAEPITIFELVLLCMVFVFALLAKYQDWHVRSIEYRLLAELFRKQQMLAALGWSLSVGNVRHMTDAYRQSWVSWLFAATQRGAPMPQGNLTSRDQRVANCKILSDLIEEQLKYHKGREKVSLKAAETFEVIGALMFLAVIVCVLAKWVTERKFENFDLVLLLGLLATVLPGVSAAFVGVRSYAELQLLAEQSHHMILELEDAQKRVAHLDLDRGLASQDLGTEAVIVATMMLQDLDGWGRLFRGKVTGVA